MVPRGRRKSRPARRAEALSLSLSDLKDAYDDGGPSKVEEVLRLAVDHMTADDVMRMSGEDDDDDDVSRLIVEVVLGDEDLRGLLARRVADEAVGLIRARFPVQRPS